MALKMSIKTRLSTIIILIGAILFLITGFLIWSDISDRDQNLFAQAILDSLRAGTKVENGLVHFDELLERYITTGQASSLEQIVSEERGIESAFHLWRQAVQTLISLDIGFSAAESAGLARNEETYAGILDNKTAALEHFRAGRLKEAKNLLEMNIKPSTKDLTASVVLSMQDIKLKVGHVYSTNFAGSSSHWIQGLLVLAVFSLFILLVSYRMSKNILESLHGLREGVETIGSGDLDHRIDIKSGDELGELALSFNEMAANLLKTTISRDYVDNILKSMIGSLIVTDAEGRIERFNRAAEILLGYGVDDLCGEPVQKIFDASSPFSENALEELEQMEDQVQKEDALCTIEGEAVPVILTVSPLRNGGGRLKGYVIGALDITERKEAELRLAKLVEDLDRANGELKDFAYIVSHDLKAPLRAISALASWIEMDYSDKLDDDGREQIRLLTGRVKRMQALIDGILQYSRVGRVKEEAEDVDLNELVADVIDSLSPPENIHVELESRLPMIHGERIRLQQVFQNLIGNAIKYMDKDQGQVKVGCAEENGDWRFYVADNGPGIEEKYFQKIFQIFQTLKARDEVESTGIGLAVVKKIIEQHKGKIWVESSLGDGSIFSFTLARS
jgi:PAS domain S-box-containing protein